jgi:hypothetical protein
MSNALSLAILIAAYAQESEEAILVLLTFEDDQGQFLRFVLNGENIISRGEVFNASWFDVVLPDDTGDRPPQANLNFPNVGREMTALLESYLIPPTVKIEIVLASDPDNVELEFPALQLQPGTKYNAQNVNGPLMGRRTAREGFPKGIICPSYFPAAF